MNKIIDKVIAISALALFAGAVIWAGSLWRGHPAGPKPSRYYVGIGVQLYQVDKSVSAMYSGNEEYSNAKQQLTGFTLVRGILKGGPAEAADLRDMDVVIGLNGQNGPPSRQVLNDTIRGGREGEWIGLKIRRIDKDGNTLKEFDVDVRRGVIDQVAWLPQDFWMTGSTSMGGADGCSYNVSVGSRFHEDKTNGRFLYDYEVKNSCTKTVTVNWDVLKGYGTKNEFFLKPGGSEQFQLSTDEFPAYADATLTIYRDEDGGRFTRFVAWLSGSNLMKSSLPAYIPASRSK